MFIQSSGRWVVVWSSLLITAVHAAYPTTWPATWPAPPDLPVAPVVRLWPNDPPATQTFDVTDKTTARGEPNSPGFNVADIRYPSLMVYLPEKQSGPRAAVIICPGGGYAYESLTYEGIDIAKRFAAEGVAGFVLRYRLPDGRPPEAGQLPLPQQDVLRAIQLIRSRAAEWNVDPQRVGVVGFSAGGHLAATAATMYDDARTLVARADDAVARTAARPDFAVLIYPVIKMNRQGSHGGSRQNLLGPEPDAALVDRFSNELHVTPRTPPLFVVHPKDDGTVPVANAHLIVEAAKKANVPHDLVLFEKGGHGFGLGNNAETRTWFLRCMDWLRSQKLIDAKP